MILYGHDEKVLSLFDAKNKYLFLYQIKNSEWIVLFKFKLNLIQIKLENAINIDSIFFIES